MLHDLYQVETSSSALDRWKAAEAEALPSIGRFSFHGFPLLPR
jgi:hypothetical protein